MLIVERYIKDNQYAKFHSTLNIKYRQWSMKCRSRAPDNDTMNFTLKDTTALEKSTLIRDSI